MCATCGCGGDTHDHEGGGRPHHHHGATHGHSHPRGPLRPRVHRLEAAILGKNDRIAAETRRRLAERRILALNLVSSPGAGKTTLLERTIAELGRDEIIHVIEGDQATSHDADRIRAAGARAVQINTGSGCHLDAAMVERALGELEPPEGALVFIENVGNLVCPALFDLGERAKVVIASVTEGEDKPLKYPHMFRASRLVLLNKADLLPHVKFDVRRFAKHVHEVNSSLETILVSALDGTGLERWISWLREAHGGC